MVKQTMAHPYNGIFLNNKKTKYWSKEVCNSFSGSRRHYATWKKPVSKGYILYDSIEMNVSKGHSKRDIVLQNRSVVARGQEKGERYNFKRAILKLHIMSPQGSFLRWLNCSCIDLYTRLWWYRTVHQKVNYMVCCFKNKILNEKNNYEIYLFSSFFLCSRAFKNK